MPHVGIYASISRNHSYWYSLVPSSSSSIISHNTFTVICSNGRVVSRIKNNGSIVWSYQISPSMGIVDAKVSPSGQVYILADASSAHKYVIIALDSFGTKSWEADISSFGTSSGSYILSRNIDFDYSGKVFVAYSSPGYPTFLTPAPNVYGCIVYDDTVGPSYSFSNEASFLLPYLLYPQISLLTVDPDITGGSRVYLYDDYQKKISRHQSSIGYVDWVLSLTVPSWTIYMKSMHTDISRNLYVGGLSASSSSEGRLIKFDDTGSLLWQTSRSHSTSNIEITAVTTNGTDVYVGGRVVTSSGNQSALLAKFNASGVLQWQREINLVGSTNVNVTSIEVRGSSDLYLGMDNAGNSVFIKIPSNGTILSASTSIGGHTITHTASSFTVGTPSITVSASSLTYDPSGVSLVTSAVSLSSTSISLSTVPI